MPTRKTARPAAPPPVTDTTLKKLVAMRAELDEERLELEREARRIAERIATIDAQILTALRQRRVRSLTAGRYEASILTKPGSLYYKGALLEELGQEEFDRRLAAVPAREVIEITDQGRIPRPRAARKPRAA